MNVWRNTMGKVQGLNVCPVTADAEWKGSSGKLSKASSKGSGKKKKDGVNPIQYPSSGNDGQRNDRRTGGFLTGGGYQDKGGSTQSLNIYFCERHKKYGIRAFDCEDPGRCKYY